MFNILKKKWIFFGIAIALSVISILSLFVRGFNLDTDFAGGIALTYEVSGDFDTEEIEKIVDASLVDKSASSIQKSGNDVIIKVGHDSGLTDDERQVYSAQVRDSITKALEEKFGAPVVEGNSEEVVPAADETATEPQTNPAEVTETADPTESAVPTETAAADVLATATEQPVQADLNGVLQSGVRLKGMDDISPSSGQELARTALWMSLLACAGILIYVTIRFEFTSGCVAIVALAFDILVLMGIYSLLQISVNINFIAAILTVLGYSINNTIVIMDRIRENTRFSRKETYAEIANASIWQTFTRSVNTTVTTLLTIGMVYIFGVVSIKAFALPIIVGIFIGFCSSVFLTGPLWATWKDSAVKAKRVNANVSAKKK